MPYLDTSILGSYYCPESLSKAVNRAIASLDDRLISPLVELELHSLISLKVRTSEMDRLAAGKVLSQFRLHLAEGLYDVVEIGPREYEIAQTWISAFNSSLRTVDALHLACAYLHQQPLWTTDKPLARAAKAMSVDHRLITNAPESPARKAP
jgi:predicted nucleic acid-binding protein